MILHKSETCVSTLRWALPVTVILLFWFNMTSEFAFCRQVQNSRDEWLAIVKPDTLVVYSHLSTDSKIVRVLKKGSRVRIDWEIIGADGVWCRVAEPGSVMSLGYVLSEGLERVHSPASIQWRIDPTSNLLTQTPTAESIQQAENKALRPVSKDEIEEVVESVLASKFEPSPLISGMDQTTSEERERLDRQNRFGFAFRPGSFDERPIIVFIPGFSSSCNGFRQSAMAAPAIGHVEMGNPLRRR